MKRFPTYLIVLFVLSNYSIAKAEMYTAYNIWKHDSSRYMYCINFKSAYEIIPAGTKVYDIKTMSDPEFVSKIEFRLSESNEKITIKMRHRWHPGITIKDYHSLMLTKKNFERLTEGMTEAEVDAIKKGKVIEGMSKKAVLVSYGYPPEHRTRSLESNAWTYWMTTVKQKVIRFDENGKVMP